MDIMQLYKIERPLIYGSNLHLSIFPLAPLSVKYYDSLSWLNYVYFLSNAWVHSKPNRALSDISCLGKKAL